jgi:hypothetical protein
MPCNDIIDKIGKRVGFLCTNTIYKVPHKGKYYYIEWNNYCGPLWLKKDLSPRVYQFPKEDHPYWEAVDKLLKANLSQKESWLI